MNATTKKICISQAKTLVGLVEQDAPDVVIASQLKAFIMSYYGNMEDFNRNLAYLANDDSSLEKSKSIFRPEI
jgi:hypothetical protein